MRYWPRRAAAVLAIAGFALLLGISSATAATLPTGFEERTVVSGLTAPSAVAWAPDGRMFVAEKGGKVRVVTAAGALVSKPLIDISSEVHTSGDRGLLGLAVDSSFASNKYLYLLYTYDTSASHATGPKSSRLTRFTVSTDNTWSEKTVLLGTHPTQPCPAPSNTLDCIASDSDSHSIGTVRSALDGTLWVGAGDGANYGGVDELALRAHNEQSLNGKLIHIDRNGNGLLGHPFCPTVTDLDPGVHQGVGEGISQPVPLHDHPERPSGSGRRGLGVVGGAEPRPAGTQLRLAVLRGALSHRLLALLHVHRLLLQGRHGGGHHVSRPLLRPRLGRGHHRRTDVYGRPLPRRVRRQHHLRRLRAGVHQAPRARRPGQAHRSRRTSRPAGSEWTSSFGTASSTT